MNVAEIRAKYPQYSDMSDDALASALHAKYYADMPMDEFAAKIGLGKQPEAKQPEPSLGDSLKRAAGLTARYAVEGMAALPGMVINPLTVAAGQKPWTQALSDTLTSFGLPQPESPGEKVSAEVSKALAGGGGLSALAQKAAMASQSVPAAVRAIANAPVAEMASQGLGAGTSEAVRESGGPEWAAIAAGVAAPMGAQAAMSAAKQTGVAAREITRPLTKAGREQIAADTLGRLTQDKTRALSNLDDYLNKVNAGQPVGVPGSRPTAAAVAADYGLNAGEQAISRGDASPLFAMRRAENNAARLDDLARLNATEKMVEQLKAKRDALTAPLRDAAFANEARLKELALKAAEDPKNLSGPNAIDTTVNFDRVRDVINRLRKTPEGGKQETARALEQLDNWIVARQAEGRVGARDGYALHQDINDLIRGKISDDKGAVRLAAGMATQIKQELANQVEKVAPGFRKYLSAYSRLSRPIERLEVITDKLGGADLSKVTTSMPLVGSEGAQYALSQDKVRRAVNAISGETRPAARQSDILSRVLGDLNAEASAMRGGKLPGSDTYQNIASANFLNRVLGQSIAESGPGLVARKAVGLVMRPFESSINDAIVNAYLDPKEMRRLLAMARTSRGQTTLAGLLSGYTPSTTGGLLGSLMP